MDEHELREAIESQRRFFATGATLDRAFRTHALAELKRSILAHEDELNDALRADLGKAPAETYMSEVFPVVREIAVASSHLRRWMRPRRKGLPVYLWPGTGHVVPEPFGTVLLLAPWNFPFQLLFAPLVGALAAGNCAVIKPSELAPRTAAVSRAIVEGVLPRDHVLLVEGGLETSVMLLAQRYDYLFYTGGPVGGRAVLEAAAVHTTPVSLELGGKNPCVVAADSPIGRAARRIAWGKFMNAGQACVAPDYVLVERAAEEELTAGLARAVREMYGEDPSASPDYGRIVSRRHFDRLVAMLGEGRIAFGGQTDPERLFIAPTGLADVRRDGPLMNEEIFGPLLPIVPYDDADELLEIIAARPAPLALYAFTSDRGFLRRLDHGARAGALSINDVNVHFTAPTLPFGGLGASGMGAYHGRQSFETFSHMKAVMKRGWLHDITVRYPPYASRGRWLAWLRRLFG